MTSYLHEGREDGVEVAGPGPAPAPHAGPVAAERPAGMGVLAPEPTPGAPAARQALNWHWADERLMPTRVLRREERALPGGGFSRVDVDFSNPKEGEGPRRFGKEYLRRDGDLGVAARVGKGPEGVMAGGRVEKGLGKDVVAGGDVHMRNGGFDAGADVVRTKRRDDGTVEEQRYSVSAAKNRQGERELLLGMNDMRAGYGEEHGVKGLKIAAGAEDNRGSLVANGDQLGVGKRGRVEHVGADGLVRRDEVSHGVNLGHDQIGYAGAAVRNRLDANGNVVPESSVSGSAGIGKDGASARVSKMEYDHEGKKKQGVSAGGGISWKDGLDANVDARADVGKLNVSFQAGINIVAGEPVLENGKWVVTYGETKKIGGGLGFDAGKWGVGGHAGEMKMDGGRRIFDTKEAALEWKKGIVGHVPDKVDLTSAAAVLAIPVGESRKHVDGSNLGLDAKGQVSVVNVGANIEHSDRKEVEVTRVDKNVVEVVVSHGDEVGGEGSVGAMGARVAVGGNRKDGSRWRLRFDLATAEGRAAFETYQKSGFVTDVVHMKLIDSSYVKERGVYAGGDLGGIANVGGASNLRQNETHIGKHKIEELEGENVKKGGIFGAKAVDRRALRGIEIDEQHRAYSMVHDIDANRGNMAAERLADEYGVAKDGVVGETLRKPSGKWQVTSVITDEQMNGFLAKAKAGALDHGDMMSKMNAAILVKELEHAPDGHARMQAVLKYMQGGGETAAAAIERLVDWGPGGPQKDLALPGDKHFTGAEFRTVNVARVSKLRQELADPHADRKAVAAQAAGALAELAERRAVLRDLTRYTDLPNQLRIAEIEKTEGYIASLEAIKAQAMGQAQAAPADGAKGVVGEVAAADGRIGDRKRRLKVLEEFVRKSQMVHGGAHAGVFNVARQRWAGSVEYPMIDGHLALLQKADEGVAAHEVAVEAARIPFLGALGDPAVAEPIGKALLCQLAGHQNLLDGAVYHAVGARDLFGQLEGRHKGFSLGKDPLAGYKKDMPSQLL